MEYRACMPVYAYIESDYEGLNTTLEDPINGIFICDADTGASCSGYYKSGTTTICSDGEHCKVDCSYEECTAQVLDATGALSLDLTCNGDTSCSYSTILCPTADDAICAISCGEDDTCESMAVVIANTDANYNSFKLNCPTEYTECGSMQITVQVAEINNIDIFCNGTCDDLIFSVEAEVVGDVSIYCSNCYESSWTADVKDFESATILCDRRVSCGRNYIGFSDAKSVTLNCAADVCASYTYSDSTTMTSRTHPYAFVFAFCPLVQLRAVARL